MPLRFTVGVLIGLGLLAVSLAYIGAYGWNPSVLFHIGNESDLGAVRPLTSGTVVLDELGYDGQHYYQIARFWPLIWSPSDWTTLQSLSTGPYAYQRILLPTVVFGLSLGQAQWLPWVFLGINLGSLWLAAWLIARHYRPLYAVALAFCPAAMVGLHFSLAEPLTLLLLTVFLLRMPERRLDALQILLLSGAVLAREVVVLFAGAVLLWYIFKRDLRSAALTTIPIGVFAAWHAWIYTIFGTAPFFWSTEKSAYPLSAVLELVIGVQGYTVYSLSSLALLAFFVLPTGVWIGVHLLKKKKIEFLPVASLAFLGVMLSMPDHIWSSATSIGRVITPVYPLVLLYSAKRDSLSARAIALATLLLGLAIAAGLTLSIHPVLVS